MHSFQLATLFALVSISLSAPQDMLVIRQVPTPAPDPNAKYSHPHHGSYGASATAPTGLGAPSRNNPRPNLAEYQPPASNPRPNGGTPRPANLSPADTTRVQVNASPKSGTPSPGSPSPQSGKSNSKGDNPPMTSAALAQTKACMNVMSTYAENLAGHALSTGSSGSEIKLTLMPEETHGEGGVDCSGNMQQYRSQLETAFHNGWLTIGDLKLEKRQVMTKREEDEYVEAVERRSAANFPMKESALGAPILEERNLVKRHNYGCLNCGAYRFWIGCVGAGIAGWGLCISTFMVSFWIGVITAVLCVVAMAALCVNCSLCFHASTCEWEYSQVPDKRWISE